MMLATKNEREVDSEQVRRGEKDRGPSTIFTRRRDLYFPQWQ